MKPELNIPIKLKEFWRPLPINIKTALIFYLGFTGLLLIINCWPGYNRETAGKIYNDNSGPTLEIADLVLREGQFNEVWQKTLLDDGFTSKNLYQVQIEKLTELRSGSTTVKWISSERTLVLPPSPTKDPLIRLGSQWKGLSGALGFKPVTEKWGYSRHYLWVKLASFVRLKLADDKIIIPVARLTLIQPVSRFKNRLGGLIPELPPELKIEAPSRWPSVWPPKISPPPISLGPPVRPPVGKRVRVAIIIDDVGFVREPADEMLKIKAPLTWAILPGAPYTRKYSEEAKAQGFQIILHLPLEPLAANENPGPGTIRRSWSKEEIVSQLNKDLADLPEAIGVNNHMGSAGTSDDRLMEVLMKELGQRKLFFVDSLTGPGSVAGKYARFYHIPFAQRKVFIDNESSLAYKESSLRELIKIALKDGQAIGIAHVRPGTAQAIEEMLPEFQKAGIEIVPVSELVK